MIDPINHKDEARMRPWGQALLAALAVFGLLVFIKVYFGVWAGVAIALFAIVIPLYLLWRWHS